jgi:uncharacterized protein YecE (DUF72 family)
MIDWYLGTMGFAYKEWLGAFYPQAMASRNYLSYYSERFEAVEIDSTFYGTPRPSTVERWTAVTPPRFKFCPKTPREITHELRLVNASPPMTHFLDTMRLLGDKLGAILIQFPPDFAYEQLQTLTAFLQTLPTNIRFAVEFRDSSWERPETADLLRNYNIAWASTDYIYLEKVVRQTADFLYLRFIGPHGQFATKDKELVDKTADLQHWHAQIQSYLDQINTVYGFFNNDYSGHSPATCNRFKKIAGQETKEIRVLQQGRLF